MERRRFLAGAGYFSVMAAGGSFLVGCAPGSGSPESNPDLAGLTFITPFQHLISYADVYVAISQGYFEEEGLSIEAVGGNGTATSVTQVTADQGQIGKAASVITCPLIADEGADIITFAQGDQRSQYSVASIPGSPLVHPSEWQGKTIGVISKGGTTELLLDAMAVAEGLDPTKVEKVVTGGDISSLEFLRNGEVDGFITFLGSESTLRQLGEELHYLNTDEFAPMPGDSYFAKRAVLQEREEELAGFVRACRKGFEFMADAANSDAVLDAVAEFNEVEVDDRELAERKLRAQVELCTPDSGQFLDLDMAAWESAVDLMREAEIITDQDTSLEDMVSTAIMDRL